MRAVRSLAALTLTAPRRFFPLFRAPLRALHASAAPCGTLEDAVAAAAKLPPADNMTKLKLYALYKQATVGACTGPAPGMFDLVGKAKHNAWSALGGMGKEEAARVYADVVRSLGGGGGGGGAAPAAAAPAAASAGSASPTSTSPPPPAPPLSGDILVTCAGPVRTITLNRPAKRNALTWAMYAEFVSQLSLAAADASTNVVVVTGAGSFFCAGNDLSNFAAAATLGPQRVADDGERTLRAFVGALIHFPKLLVAAVNGPAIGIAMTTLPLFDLVYASSRATLHAPLTALGQTPEGTASHTFVAALGPARAAELLLLGRKLTAGEAAARGLVNEVFEDGAFAAALAERVAALAALPPQALRLGKQALREPQRAALDAANAAECALIKQRWLSDECMAAVSAFLAKRG